MSHTRAGAILLVATALAAPTLLETTGADHAPTVSCLVALLGCPDLTTDAGRFEPFKETRTFSPGSCEVVEGNTMPGTRTLLRFRFTTPNIGAADLVVGSPQGNPNFEYSDCHGHFHFKEFADYTLWTPEQHAQYQSLRAANPSAQAHEILEAHPELQPVRGDKRSFCVIDVVQRELVAPPKYLTCEFQGISVGWADEYAPGLSGQYIDVTGVASGEYVLEAEVNAEHVYEESDYDNNRAWVSVTI